MILSEFFDKDKPSGTAASFQELANSSYSLIGEMIKTSY